MEIAPKAMPRSTGTRPDNVRDIEEGKGKGRGGGGGAGGRRRGGRPSGLGYDPAKGEEVRSETYLDAATRESTSETDVFTLVNERGYRPERFYTRSINADGHGEKLNVRVPQGLDSQMHAAVGTVPEYRSVHDLVRDAVVHRLEYLQKHYTLDEGARRVIELERLMADMAQRDREIERMKEAVAQVEESLKVSYESKDYAMMADQLDVAEDLLDWLREPYLGQARDVVARWKKQARDEIQAVKERLED